MKEKKDDLINTEEFREKVLKIEKDIKSIVGAPKNDGFIGILKTIERERLDKCLRLRSYYLDMLFRKDPKGVERFRKVNEVLKDLSDRMYRKGVKIYRQYLSSGVDEEFDDDFMLEADLRFVYNDEQSVAEIGDEEYYGSDFKYMMNLIFDICNDVLLAGASFSKDLKKSDRPEMSDMELELYNSYDDDWHELKNWIPELEGIKICNAVNEICVYNQYSVVDLLRMNDFWTEVKAIYQNICKPNDDRII